MYSNRNAIHIASFSALVFIALCFAGITSCKKSNNPVTVATGTFYFHLHSNIDTSEVDDKTKLYRDASGRHFGLSVAQFFISSVVLHNVTGGSYTIPNVEILKDLDGEDYIIGTAPVGTYSGFTFNVGLDAAGNALAPISSTSPEVAGMWFGNTTKGYMCMKLQGFADTTASNTGTNLVYFSFQVGLQGVQSTIALPARSGTLAPYILTKDGTQYIHLICDYGKLLSGVDFKALANTPGHGTTDTYNIHPEVATKIISNIPSMISYEE